MTTQDLKQALQDWADKVTRTHENTRPGTTDKFKMLQDVDKILSEAFDRDPIL